MALKEGILSSSIISTLILQYVDRYTQNFAGLFSSLTDYWEVTYDPVCRHLITAEI